ncbi:MAG: hypothetical protein ACKVQW_01005 [Pyrinomonadaceae bacterium]
MISMVSVMDKTGYIEIRVVGRKGAIEISPDNYDIKEIIAVLQHAENLLYPGGKRDRPSISYEIKDGSVRHVLKTALQAVIGFNAILLSVQQSGYSIDFLESPTAKALEFFQESARKQDVAFEISTSLPNTSNLEINKDTAFVRSDEIWAHAEFYFYGTLQDAGGKSEANIHLDTKEFGLLKISAEKQMLGDYEANPLYKLYGIRATGKQNIHTGEIDKSSLNLVEIINYDKRADQDYLNGLIAKASASWRGISDADDWLSRLRG